MSYNTFWARGIELPKLKDKYGGYGRKFNLKVTGTLSHAEVRARANVLRMLVQQQHPGVYDMQVSVLHKGDGQWKSAGFFNTSDKNFHVWSPEEYETEFDPDENGQSQSQNDELEAKAVTIIFYRN